MFNFFRKKSNKELPLGQWGEQKAQELYKAKGFSILESNYFNRKGKRLGEVDFVAHDKECICFVEVKTRTRGVGGYGGGAEAVDGYKQKKLLKAVKMYLGSHSQYMQLRPQIDVCIIEVDEFDRGQFSATILMNAVEDTNY